MSYKRNYNQNGTNYNKYGTKYNKYGTNYNQNGTNYNQNGTNYNQNGKLVVFLLYFCSILVIFALYFIPFCRNFQNRSILVIVARHEKKYNKEK
jgi:hypothetical protein